MSETMNTSKTSGKPTGRSGGKAAVRRAATPAAQQPKIEAATERAMEQPARRVAPTLDPNTVVTVRNGFNGTLIYKSRKTGEKFVWDGFGAEQDMELSELKSARNSSKSFFENNWFLIDDLEVIDYLNVGQYYKNALRYEDFDTLFDGDPADVERVLNGLSAGQKRTVSYRARALVADGKIDSLSMIAAIERALAVKLTDAEQ